MSITKPTALVGLLFILGCGSPPVLEFEHKFNMGDEEVAIVYTGDVMTDYAWALLVADVEHFVDRGDLVIADGVSERDRSGRSGRNILLKYDFGGSYRLFERIPGGMEFEIPEHLAKSYHGASESIWKGGYTEHSLNEFIERLNSYQDSSFRNEIHPLWIDSVSEENLERMAVATYFLFEENLARWWFFDVDGRERVPGAVIGFSRSGDGTESDNSGLQVRLAVFIDGRWSLWR